MASASNGGAPLETGEVFLRHDFISGKRDTVHVEVTKEGVLIKKETKKGIESRLTYPYADILGAEVSGSGELHIGVCPFFKKTKLRKAARRVEIIKLRTDGNESDAGSLALAQSFCLPISRGCRGLDITVNEKPPARRFLVYVNPFSGTKQAEKLLNLHVRPMLAIAGVDAELVVSKRQGFVQDHAKTVDVSDKECVMIVSGDGLLTEALNGFMARSDWRTVLETPFATIPAGSGNALAASLLHASKENYGVVEAVYVALKGSSVPLDVMSVQTERRRVYSALSVTWGLLGDIDIGSEKFRRLGSARFTLSFLQQLTSIKRYTAKLSYLPADAVAAKPSQPGGSTCDNVEAVKGISVGVLPANKPEPTPKRRSLRKKRPATATASTTGNQSTMSSASIDSAASPSTTISDGGVSESSSYLLPESRHLPPFSDPPPSSWVVVDGQFTSVSPLLVSHIGWDMFMLRNARLADGLINLIYVGSTTNRASLLSIFTEIGSGSGNLMALTDNPAFDLHCIPVKAFRLEMDPNDSYLAIDGEHVNGGAIQCQVHPSLIKVIALLPSSCGEEVVLLPAAPAAAAPASEVPDEPAAAPTSEVPDEPAAAPASEVPDEPAATSPPASRVSDALASSESTDEQASTVVSSGDAVPTNGAVAVGVSSVENVVEAAADPAASEQPQQEEKEQQKTENEQEKEPEQQCKSSVESGSDMNGAGNAGSSAPEADV